MIKAENSPKILKNPRNFPKKTQKFSGKFPKNPKNLPSSFAWQMGGSGFAGQGVYFRGCKIFHREGILAIPPLLTSDYN